MKASNFTRRAITAGLFGAGLVAVTRQEAHAMPFDRSRLSGAPVQIKRGFGEGSDDLQLHYRRAEPIDRAKLTSALPVLCLHQTPNSSQVFVEFMEELGRDRIVYAVDTPGLGESDTFAEPPEVGDYARAMLEFIKNEALGPVDIVGYHTGASIALEMANQKPDAVNSMMLVGLALFDADERAGFFKQPWPKPIEADGSHLVGEWQRSHDWRGPGQTDASVQRTFLTKISAGSRGWWGARAVMSHDLEASLKNASQPILILNPKDDLFAITPRAKNIRPELKIVDFPKHGFGVFEIIPDRLAACARKHFDRKS